MRLISNHIHMLESTVRFIVDEHIQYESYVIKKAFQVHRMFWVKWLLKSTPTVAQHILVFLRLDDFFQDKNADRMNDTWLIVSYIHLPAILHSIIPSSNTVLCYMSNEGDVMSPTFFLFLFYQ